MKHIAEWSDPSETHTWSASIKRRFSTKILRKDWREKFQVNIARLYGSHSLPNCSHLLAYTCTYGSYCLPNCSRLIACMVHMCDRLLVHICMPYGSHLHALWFSFIRTCAPALHVNVGIFVHICMPNYSYFMAILFTFPSIWVHILTQNGSHFTSYAHKC